MTTDERDTLCEASFAAARRGEKTFPEHYSYADQIHEEWLGGPEIARQVADFQASENAQKIRERNAPSPPTPEQLRLDAMLRHIDD